MPQLDKINWLFILGLLVFFVISVLVNFIKRNFYSWRKISLLKILTTVQVITQNKNISIFSFLALTSQFLQLRKTYYRHLNLGKTTLISGTVHQLDKTF